MENKSDRNGRDGEDGGVSNAPSITTTSPNKGARENHDDHSIKPNLKQDGVASASSENTEGADDDNNFVEIAETSTPSSPSIRSRSSAPVSPTNSVRKQKGTPDRRSNASPTTDERKGKITTTPSITRRKRTRSARIASIVDDNKSNPARPKDQPPTGGLTLPPSQYEVTLIRRAVRQADSSKQGSTSIVVTDKSNGNKENTVDEGEIDGDVSLGMAFNNVDEKIVVQSLRPLSDGRASPAQLAGLIRRGDVLISVNNKSLAHVPVNQLPSVLSPPPDSETGLYQREITLRFDAGGGLYSLIQFEKSQRERNQAALAPKIGLHPMIDQLSGMPYGPSVLTTVPTAQSVATTSTAASTTDTTVASSGNSVEETNKQKRAPSSTEKLTGESTTVTTPHSRSNERISLALAEIRRRERRLAISQFFAWNPKQGSFLRGNQPEQYVPAVATGESLSFGENMVCAAVSTLTKEQFVERGQRAILGATALTNYVERLDSGKDIRSFRSWKTTLSLRSTASTRRRYALDNFSLPGKVQTSTLPTNTFVSSALGKTKEEEEGTEDGTEANPAETSTIMSGADSDRDGEEEVDGDEILLRLAAHDELWRKQVVEFLQNATKLSDVDEAKEAESEGTGQPPAHNSNELDSSIFSSFLFGEKMSKLLNKRVNSQALPPGDITAVLFDLTTKLKSCMDDDVAIPSFVHTSARSVGTPIQQKQPPSEQLASANEFLLKEALPVWHETFRPLPWNQRRVLWPVYSQHQNGSGFGGSGSIVSDDITLESVGTASTANRQRVVRKNLREQVEEQALDAETREETCYLLTHYFSSVLIPNVRCESDDTEAITKAKDFIQRFGAYLKLHTCLTRAAGIAGIRAQELIDMLLKVARHDLRHRETIKHVSKLGSLVLYEESMLSAFLQLLKDLPVDKTSDASRKTIDLCASAYPDVLPWQVEKKCMDGAEQTEGSTLHYTYLTNLLHPIDGHDRAKKDRRLVNNWCRLSVELCGMTKDAEQQKECKMNFTAVASVGSSTHVMYARDLVLLLNLAMEFKETNLALDLAQEILLGKGGEHTWSRDDLLVVQEHLRTVGCQSLQVKDKVEARHLRRVLTLLQRVGSASTNQNVLIAWRELLYLLETKLPESGGYLRADDMDLIAFLANEAHPEDTLIALSKIAYIDEDLFPVLRVLLKRAAHELENSELSLSLMRIQHARHDIEESRSRFMNSAASTPTQGLIWDTMKTGTASFAK